MSQSNTGPSGWAARTPLAGAVLAVSAALVLLAMGHHPTGHGGGGLSLVQLVHGAMIILLLAQLWALSVFSLAREGDGWRLAGLVAYGASTFAHLVAGTVNGFVVPSLAARGDEAAPHASFLMLWEINQQFAALGVWLTSAAFILWSVGLAGSGGMGRRLVGVAGLAAGGAPVALLVSGAIRLDVAGAFVAYGLHSVWLIILGAALWRRSFD